MSTSFLYMSWTDWRGLQERASLSEVVWSCICKSQAIVMFKEMPWKLEQCYLLYRLNPVVLQRRVRNSLTEWVRLYRHSYREPASTSACYGSHTRAAHPGSPCKDCWPTVKSSAMERCAWPTTTVIVFVLVLYHNANCRTLSHWAQPTTRSWTELPYPLPKTSLYRIGRIDAPHMHEQGCYWGPPHPLRQFTAGETLSHLARFRRWHAEYKTQLCLVEIAFPIRICTSQPRILIQWSHLYSSPWSLYTTCITAFNFSLSPGKYWWSHSLLTAVGALGPAFLRSASVTSPCLRIVEEKCLIRACSMTVSSWTLNKV